MPLVVPTLAQKKGISGLFVMGTLRNLVLRGESAGPDRKH